MPSWSTAFRSALESRLVQAGVACALAVPAVATAGQYWSSGFWGQSAGVQLLFWPGQSWTWTVRLPVWFSMGSMLALYFAGIAWLLRHRALTAVVFCAAGTLIAAKLLGTAVNHVTGWRELETISSMNLAGKADRAIFSLWHNPVWEECVFRGIPLLALLAARRRAALRRPALWAYYLVPSLLMAIYHVPGHGPSRLLDTFLISLAFAWMTLRYSFFAPLVMHDVFDAVMTLSLSKVQSIPHTEIAWLVRNATVLNSTWSIALLASVASIPLVALFYRFRRPRAARQLQATA